MIALVRVDDSKILRNSALTAEYRASVLRRCPMSENTVVCGGGTELRIFTPFRPPADADEGYHQ